MTQTRTARILRALEPVALVVTPLSLAAMAYWQVDQSALLSILPVLVCLTIFFASFEASRPSLRQIMPTVVLAALAAAGRIICALLPNVQPVAAIVIIAGVVFGRRCGFMVGALSLLLSNFFLGQGPWTPWQMYGFALIGYLAGVLADRNAFLRRPLLYVFGLLAPILGSGFLLNSWYIIGYVHPITIESALLAYVAALPLDAASGISTVVFLLALYAPWRRKLERIRNKYALIPEGEFEQHGTDDQHKCEEAPAPEASLPCEGGTDE